MRSRFFLGCALMSCVVAASTTGCLERELGPQDSRSTARVVEQLKPSAVDRIDLLLAIDNSGSMGDKQEILARAVPDLVKRLANPYCVDANGEVVANQPDSPTAECPAGSEREFYAVPDIHIGIVSSSIGWPVCEECAPDKTSDKGHLLSRALDGGSVPTYQELGFLAWDPNKKLDPPGETVLDSGTTGLVPTLQEMVRGVGETGDPYEAQLESWYRFLIQPDPPDRLVAKGDDVVPDGIDDALLAQRKAFLRPDSLVAILMLTDENDCSIAPGKGAGKFFGAKMARPRSECETNPLDACCAPCDEVVAGCPEDPACTGPDGEVATIDKEDDSYSLRCFDQKRRFGKDYLYPIERYVNGLTQPVVPDRDGNLVPNPLYEDLDPSDDLRGSRSVSHVFLAGITGVPWQDIARDPTSLVSGLLSAKELSERDAQGRTTWDIILGDPGAYVSPKDPHMLESREPREGTNPITGDSLAPPDAGSMADPISGHEQPTLSDTLQYACIFPLLAPIANSKACASPETGLDPLCQDASGAYTTTQHYAKAYPGLRELSVLKGIEDQAIVASVCPANLDAQASAVAPDFGYRPATSALIDQLRNKLEHQCLPRKLTPNESGQVGCIVVEARSSDACSCDAQDGRIAIPEEHQGVVIDAVESGRISADASCFCEVPQLDGDELAACQNDPDEPLVVGSEPVNGFCYIDAMSVPAVGSPDLVPETCASTERRLVRLVGKAKAQPGSSLYIVCQEG